MRTFKRTRSGDEYEVLDARELAEIAANCASWVYICGYCGTPIQGGTRAVDDHMSIVHDDCDRHLVRRR